MEGAAKALAFLRRQRGHCRASELDVFIKMFSWPSEAEHQGSQEKQGLGEDLSASSLLWSPLKKGARDRMSEKVTNPVLGIRGGSKTYLWSELSLTPPDQDGL